MTQHDPNPNPPVAGFADTGSAPIATEQELARLWQEVLGLPRIAPSDNFFEVGGTSLLAVVLLSRINRAFHLNLKVTSLFEYPTVHALSSFLGGTAAQTASPAAPATGPGRTESAGSLRQASESPYPAIAVIGMTGRFPGAETVEDFWNNLSSGTESISFFTPDQLEGDDPSTRPAGFVPARPILPDADKFDAAFFNIYPREAELMDPQHRLFLECSWEALERAGYDPAHTTSSVGVFAGCSMNTYFMQNIATGREFLQDFTSGYQVGSYTTMMGNDKDFLPTRISYKLNLRGPSMTVQTACSTSLVAVCQACQSLMTGGCDMALAGAVSITFPQHRGYIPQEGGIVSLDGHVRPFDAAANGTVFGDGAAVLLLKRLDDALADGDQVLAVIRGFGLNNDGAQKVGYTAPSVDGQAKVILRAQQMAGVTADSITYVEAHGTGTPLGDPIEFAALQKAFRSTTSATTFCSIGSAKANVGHLDVAGGATGLIKTVLQLNHRTIPALVHFTQPNPNLDLTASPFYFNQESSRWSGNGGPLRAGVSAFGVGGTNAHVIVEEAPAAQPSTPAPPHQLLVWSAKTPEALTALTANLAAHFTAHPDQNLADAAFTLQTGRSRHSFRRSLAVSSPAEAAKLLATDTSSPAIGLENPSIVFCFPGQGTQAVNMGRALYDSEPVFRQYLELCNQKLLPLLIDPATRQPAASLLSVLYPAEATPAASERINQTLYAQPAIFAIEYALAQLWLSWGIRPAAMVGHSIGEYVAATLSGVLSLDDAIRILSTRASLMQSVPRGGMLAVRTSEESVNRILASSDSALISQLDIAAVNSPTLCVVSGTEAAITALIAILDAEKIASRRLVTSHAFHSRMVEPILPAFGEAVASVTFNAPSIPYISTLTGQPVTLDQLHQPEYWTRHLRHTVRFADAITTLSAQPGRIYLEVGPAETLTQLIRQSLGPASRSDKNAPVVLSTLGPIKNAVDPAISILTALGQLWSAGADPDWVAFHAASRRQRVLLPTYPFERKRYWIDPPARSSAASTVSPSQLQAQQFQVQSNVQAPYPAPAPLQSVPLVIPLIPAKEITMQTTMLEELKALIADLSGTDLTGAEPESSFLELGFDSLFLTQLTQGIQSKYKVKLTFRQIMESFPTLDSLAAHLDSSVAPQLRASAPAPALPAPAPAAIAPAPATFAAPTFAAAPAYAPAYTPAASGSGYEALFAAQMQAMTALMQQQFEILRGQQGFAPAAPLAPAPVAAAPIPTATPAPAAITPATSAPATPSKPVFVPFKPISRGDTAGLTPVQEKYLSGFISDYNTRTPSSKEFTQQHRAVFADGRVVSGFNAPIKEMVYPLVVERAAGAYLWDKDGNRYIDILNGYGAILYGHSPDFIVNAVREQLNIGFAIGPQTELAGQCAELVRELTGMERVTFANTGSEAVMGAMRLARTVTGRNLVVLFSGDYHGSFDEVLVKSVGNGRSMPVAPGIPRESVANILVLDYGTPEALETIRQRIDDIAAVLVEPVQSRHPELRPIEFLKEVRRITEESGAALIFDEVVTGFRTHPGGMQALYGIRADLATYGKVVAGGLPVGILAGSPTFMDALDGGMWQYGDDSFPQVGVTFYAGTFMRHPLALAAVKASLEHIRDSGPSLQTNLTAKTSALVADINSMFAKFGYPSTAETFSSWFFFPVPQDPRLARLLHFHLRELGIHIQEGFPCFLTTSHTDADLETVRAAFRTSLERMQAGHALPQPGAVTPESHHLLAHSVALPVAPTADHITHHVLAAPAAATQPAREPVAHDFPITEQQREVLIGTQLGDEANCAFNESTSLRLTGQLNSAALIDSLKTLVARHEILRATISVDGETVHVAASLPLPLVEGDFSNLSADDRAAKHAELLRTEASTPFNLQSGPLFRVHLVRLAPEDHVLVFTAHHIIFDGWSTNVLYGELSTLYNAAVSGTAPALEPALAFSEYATAQHTQLNSSDRAATESFWLSQFKTIPSPLQLPIDRPRPALRSNEGNTLHYKFDPTLLQAVRKAGARQGSTLFATLLTAYSLLIHRLSQQDDVVIGIPVAGQAALDNGSTLVGHGVNFLPIRSQLSPAASLSQFLKQTRKTLLDAQDHQDYTYGTLLHKLTLPRDPSRLQLVEVQFNVEQVGAGLAFNGLAVDLHANPKTHVNMDLFFNFVDRGTELWLDCDYNTGLFDDATIQNFFGYLESILRAFVADPVSGGGMDQPVSKISLLSPAQQDQILTAWNQTATVYPRDSSIHREFERQALLTPASIAVTDGKLSLTYAELNEKANQLAHYLVANSIAPGARVALCLDRSLETIVGFIAILKAGAGCVPIDPTYPATRLAFLLTDSAPAVFLTQQSIAASLASTLSALPLKPILLDQDWPVIALESPANLPLDGAATDLAYVMYTSGSTGNPKGVLVPHRAVLRLVKNNHFATFGTNEVILQLATVSFDASTFEIWGALLNGGKLVLGPKDRVTPEEIGILIATHGITTLWLTAALFHLMVTEHLDALRPLTQLLAGGDVLSVTHVRRVLTEIPTLRLINGYGPTEGTTFTCCHDITLDSLAAGTVPIGRPIANTRIYILDAAMQPVPTGVAGLLYAAGDGLALGYLNAPELTAAKFITQTFPNGVTERLYSTGDLARYRSNGVVEFLGRADTQVKIRGYRVELAEIEYALESSPLVRAAVVAHRADWVSATDNPGDKRLAAYVIPATPGDDAALIASLRKHLTDQLPEYMQPAAIMVVDNFPRTINGKVDRRALPAPQSEQMLRERAIVYPRNPAEETLAGIWAKALGLKEVSVLDSIFELGGDSLLIFRISTLANQAGLKITARHMFQFRTIAAICEQLEKTSDEATAAQSVEPIKAVSRTLHRRPQTTLR